MFMFMYLFLDVLDVLIPGMRCDAMRCDAGFCGHLFGWLEPWSWQLLFRLLEREAHPYPDMHARYSHTPHESSAEQRRARYTSMAPS